MTVKKKGCAAAFFDLDLTIIERDSLKYFISIQYLRKYRHWRFIPRLFLFCVLRKFRIISLQLFKKKSLMAFVGKQEPQLKELGDTFFKEHLSQSIRYNAKKEIIWHKRNGRLVFILTASPDIYVGAVARYFQCDGYECTKLEYRDNKFTGKFLGKDCQGKEKRRKLKMLALKMGIDLKNSYAYSDHESDYSMLELVGNPIVISPSAQLHKIASQKAWEIKFW